MSHLFGDKLRYLRHQHKITQEELAKRVGTVTQAHIANIEAGRDVASLALVLRVASVFGVAADYLIRDTVPVEAIIWLSDEISTGDSFSANLFGKKLRTHRRNHDLTQIELIQGLHLTGQGYLSNLEAGRKAPSLDLVVRIADFFGVTTDYLLRDDIPV